MGRVLLATTMLFGLLLGPRPAAAQIDATGAWHIGLMAVGFPVEFDTTIVQTGTSLSILWYSGTVDTTTGTFHLEGVRHCWSLENPVGVDVTVTMDGTFAPDGSSFTATFTDAVQAGRSCLMVNGAGGGIRTRTFACGDGISDPTEACDGGPCCNATCDGGPPAGTICGTDPATCLDLVCDADHACVLGTEDTVEDECVPLPTTTTTTSTTSTTTTVPTTTSSTIVTSTTTTTTTTSTTTSTTSTTLPALLGARKIELGAGPDPDRKRLTVRSGDRTIGLGLGDGSIDDPTIVGGTLRVAHRVGPDQVYALPASGWQRLGGNRGYRYRDSRQTAGPITAATVKAGRSLAIAARGALLGHSLVVDTSPVEIVLTLGSRRYCLEAATGVWKPGLRFTASRTPAPAACAP